MTGRPFPGSLLGFETFGAAVGLTIVAGALSLVAPDLTVLAGTLAALAVAGWASLRYRGRPVPAGNRSGTPWVALAAAAAGAVAFLDPPGLLGAFRGLILGIGLVPLWVAERKVARRASLAEVGR
jgi:hypothetical protein